MSGLEVIGAISAVIGVIDASAKTYESVRKDAKLNETFRTVGCRLPVILNTLRACKDHLEPIQDTLSPAICEALETMIEACDMKAVKLRQIFEKTLPGNNEGWEKRYVKVFTRLGKGNKVEELMLSITEDVQLLVNHHAVQSAKPEQQAVLDTIIRELKAVPSSVPKEEQAGYSFNSGGGAQTNNINSGPGQQINNNAAVGTQNINSVTKPKEDFSFRKPLGMCLGQAPYIDASLFVGRDAEIKEIRDILTPGMTSGKQQRLVLGGMGGIGKTQLAIAYGKRHDSEHRSIFWLNAASEATIKASFRAMADLIFEVQDSTVLEGEQSVTHTHRWLSDTSNMQWLLIFDNYDDPDDYNIEVYYPPASHGAIIITTRRPDRVAGATIRVQPLSDVADSLDILRTRSDRTNVSDGML